MGPSLHLMFIAVIYCGMIRDGISEENVKKESQESLNFYSFPVMDITENIISLDELKGKVSLVVNVASQCGYTDGHYRMLNLLQKMFDETDKFSVLAFPCNQFGGQEPGNHHEILDFAYHRMGVTFPIFAKVDIIDQDVNPAWNYLIRESGVTPSWNFFKYLVDHTGHVINAWGPSISPDQLYPYIQTAVDKALAAEAKQKEKKNNKATTKNSGKQKRDEF